MMVATAKKYFFRCVKLKRRGLQSTTSRRKLMAALTDVRLKGFEIDNGELSVGLR